MQAKRDQVAGFTLVELSIVLVIIGLLVGGVLTGRNLIEAAGIRATLTQIEQYTTAMYTFKSKYNCLPGDCAKAAQYGFIARGTQAGQGNGNGIIEGYDTNSNTMCIVCVFAGEAGVFWVDLSAAELVNGSFTIARSALGYGGGNLTPNTTPDVSSIMPEAKMGGGNYIYVWSGGPNKPGWVNNGRNYFGLSAVTSVGDRAPATSTGVTVSQAYNMDQKADDGFPQSGSVLAAYVDYNHLQTVGVYTGYWDNSAATPASTTSCYDNGNVAGQRQQYSTAQNDGAGVNCALSFRFK